MTTTTFRSALKATGLRKSFDESSTASTSILPRERSTRCSAPTAPAKTTTVQILSTLIGFDGGNVRVAGHDLTHEPDAVRGVIGVTGQFSAVDNLLTGEENLNLMADLRHLERTEGRRRIAELLDQFDLVEAGRKPAATYSGGMRRRLDLAMTLGRRPAHHLPRRANYRPRPTQPPHHVADHSRSRAGGVTIFLTTQNLDEADQLADQVAVLDHGRLIAEGTPDELKRLIPGGHIRLLVYLVVRA